MNLFKTLKTLLVISTVGFISNFAAAAEFNCANANLLTRNKKESGLTQFSFSDDCIVMTRETETYQSETIIDGQYHEVFRQVVKTGPNSRTTSFVVYEKCSWVLNSAVKCSGYKEYIADHKIDYTTHAVFTFSADQAVGSNETFDANGSLVKTSHTVWAKATCEMNPYSKFCKN